MVPAAATDAGERPSDAGERPSDDGERPSDDGERPSDDGERHPHAKCKVKYNLWTSGRNPHVVQELKDGDTVYEPPCKANIEAKVYCYGGIRRHVTIELTSHYGRKRIAARGENSKPYFLYGNTGYEGHELDVFKGDIGSPGKYEISTDVYGKGPAYPRKLEFKFEGECKGHRHE